jgi:NADH dehydrogenase (ubiquinone) Fe-S protein 7
MQHPPVDRLWLTRTSHIAKPSASLVPALRPAAFISTSDKKAATSQEISSVGDVKGNPSMSVTGRQRREVPLPSQEAKKGAMQYALYVGSSV